MGLIISRYILLFFVYSTCFGWVLEVIVSFIRYHKFINRGFMIGPYCPIYGVGGLLITLFLTRYQDDVFVFFVMTMFVCTVLEYITSYLMEKLFHARWWDYHYKKFNINGRVCVDVMAGFGLIGILVVYLLNPILFKYLEIIPSKVTIIIATVFAVVFLTDLIVSAVVISNLKHIKFKNRKDNTEEITKQVKNALMEKDAFTKRLVEAFPNFQVLIKKTKEKFNETKKEIKKKQREIKKMQRKLKKKQKELIKFGKKEK